MITLFIHFRDTFEHESLRGTICIVSSIVNNADGTPHLVSFEPPSEGGAPCVTLKENELAKYKDDILLFALPRYDFGEYASSREMLGAIHELKTLRQRVLWEFES